MQDTWQLEAGLHKCQCMSCCFGSKMVGVKQKLAVAEDERKRRKGGGLEKGQASCLKNIDSNLASRMLDLWGKGKLSAAAMQAMAEAAIRDGLRHKEVEEIASLGCNGAYTSNIHRDLLKLLQKKIANGILGGLKQSPKLALKVPAKDQKNLETGQTEADFHVFLPHLMVASWAESYPQLMDACFGVSKAAEFWDQIKADDPRLIDSPVAREKANQPEEWEKRKEKVIPLWLHGDGVEFGTDSLLLFSFGGSLTTLVDMQQKQAGLEESQNRGLKKGTDSKEGGLKQGQESTTLGGLKQSQVIDSAICLAAWPKAATAADTWKEVFDVLAWSFQSLWQGIHPAEDWKGSPLKGSLAHLAGKPLTKEALRFYVWNYLGDLEYYANTLKLPHWNRKDFCWLCDARRDCKHKSPWDFRNHPSWKMLDARGLKESPPSSHPLLTKIPTCVVGYRPCIDILHTLDLGVSQRLCGSVLHTWCYQEACEKAMAPKNMREVWNRIQDKYKSMRVKERFTNIFLSQFSNTEHPWSQAPLLKGKAAEIRHLVPVLASVAWDKAMETGGLKENHVAECLHHLATFYDLVASADFFMTPDESNAALQAMQSCLQHYVWLQRHVAKDCLFQLVPKFHWAYHLAQMCKYQNPKTFWTYRQESWVGSMATIAHSCSHGTKNTKLSESFCEKYLLGLQLRLNQ